MPIPNYYKMLGIPENADEATIKAAYRKLARQYHPDSAYYDPDPTATFTFSDIVDAFDTLRDPIKRASYDATLRVRSQQPKPPHAYSQTYTYRPAPPPTPPIYQPRRVEPIAIFRMILIGVVILLPFIVGGFYDDSDDPKPFNTSITPEECTAANAFCENDETSNTNVLSQTEGTVDTVLPENCLTSDMPCETVFYHYTVNDITYYDQHRIRTSDDPLDGHFTVYYSSTDPTQNYIVQR